MNKAKNNLLEKTYQRFMKACFNELDPAILKDVADKLVMGFGTTYDEKVFSLEKLLELLKNQQAQSKDLHMTWNTKPLHRHISEDENTAIFGDDVFLHVQMDGETIEMYMRISVVLEYKKDKWLVVHWHASKPENVESEKDTFGIDTWKEKAEALEKVVVERTADLVVKNRELEIETSLEKVRGVAMGMRQPDDLLNICEVMFQELNKLGFEDLRNAMINIHYDDQAYLLNYDYSDSEGKTISTFKYNTHPIVDHLIYHAKQSSDHFTEMIYEGKDLNEWRKFRKENGEVDDVRLDNVDALYYYFYSIGTGAVGISLFKAANEEQLNVLKRFRNVFDLAYKRYVDITTAETQAREAQIEAALERVRSRTMAMHQTSELQEVIFTVHKELLNLNLSIDGGSFVVINDDVEPVLRCWGAGGTADTSEEITVPDFGMPFVKNLIKGIKNGSGFFTEEFSQKEKKKYFKKLFEHKPWSDINDEEKNETLSIPGGYTRSVAVSKNTSVFIINHKGRKFSEAENDILNRFAKVFEQTYSRFLDLQKAEAQAMEAKIEAALERVRARTMGMFKSDELAETTRVLFTEFKRLNVLTDVGIPDRAFISTVNEEKAVVEFWITAIDGSEINRMFEGSINEPVVFSKAYKAWKRHERSMVIDVYGDDLIKYLDYLKSIGFPVNVELYELHRVNTVAFFSKGFIGITSLKFLPPESMQMLERFAQVFDITYTRFLDLQKAEEQAREAQIELGLERVRASAMAMHSSAELKKVVKTLFEELTHLGVNVHACLIATFDPATFNQRSWMIHFRTNEPYTLLIPQNAQPFYIEMLRAWKERTSDWTYMLEGDAKMKWENFLFSDTDFTLLPQNLKEEIRRAEKVFFAASYYGYGAIQASSTSPFSKQSIDLLQRFSKVFDSCYTRFLDLQKAEAQSRESQIELALERVRARTMAMQKSDELSDAVYVLFQQFKELGEEPDQATIGVINEDENVIEYWVTMYGKSINKVFKFSIDEPNVTRKIYKAWKENKISLVIDLSGDALTEFMIYRAGKGGAAINPDEKRRIINVAFFSKGLLNVQSNVKRSEESIKLLERFATVFNQTYTRFLDLQKAEAQSRESQIELALERVRARTMAMQKSDELKEVIQLVYDQFVHLNINVEHTGFILDYKDRDDLHIWLADQHLVPSEVIIPCFDSIPNNSIKEAKDNGRDFFKYLLDFEEKNKFYRDLFEFIPGVPEETLKYYLNCPGLAGSGVLLENIGLYIENFDGTPYTDEENNTLMRLGKVFQQTYTRFLDLQKAEAQAREAQIELGLERVRARAMAMQKSDELKELIGTVFTELTKLDLVLTRCVIMTYDIKTLGITWWIANSEDPSNPSGLFVKYHQLDPHLAYIKAWKQRDLKWQYVLEGEIKKEWDDFLFVETELSHLPDFVIAGMKAPDKVYLNASFNSFGNLTLASLEPLSNEHSDILLRFAKVFDLTYTRFNDLQKAEAQARESQIEAALEKVRSRSLAMHKSGEIIDVARAVFEKLNDLAIEVNTAFIIIFKEGSRDSEWWLINREDQQYSSIFVQYNDLVILRDQFEAKEQGYELFSATYHSEAKKELFRYLFTQTDFKYAPPERQKFIFESEAISVSMAMTNKIAIQVTRHNENVFSQEDNEILKRFSKVFDQSYTRFLDLKKAEAQAREAEIELALERLRARTMAMQHSDELADASFVLDSQIRALGINTRGCAFNIYGEKDSTEWFSSEMGTMPAYKTPRENLFLTYYENRKTGAPMYIEAYSGEVCAAHYAYLCTIPVMGDGLKEMIKSGGSFPTQQIDHVTYFKYGYLLFITLEQVPEAHDIFIRFAKIFEQTYTRFLDLQKAEEQAREAQIENALEKVRSRTMAMQKSEELQDTTLVLFQQFKQLCETTNQVSICIFDDEVKHGEMYLTLNGEKIDRSLSIDLDKEVFVMSKVKNAFLQKQKSFSHIITGKDLQLYNRWRNSFIGTNSWDETNGILKDSWYVNGIFFSKGMIGISSYSATPDDLLKLLERFAGVFDGTYTRFSDLKKAEAQARESQIEAALERVRSRTMAMQKSGELAEAATLVFQQFTSLGLLPDGSRVFFSLIDEDTVTSEVWTTKEDGILRPGSHPLSLRANMHLSDVYDYWKQKKLIYNRELRGKELMDYLKYIASVPNLRDDEGLQHAVKAPPEHLVFTEVFFAQGTIGVIGFIALTPESQNILMRFAKVFEQTYTRFLDLQKAETQARESQIEAALERVRSRTMAMQSSNELAETSAILFRQLIHLGIAPNRLYIGITNDKNTDIEFWITDEDGSKVSTMFSGDANKNDSIKKMYNGWKQKKKSIIIDMHGRELEDYFHYLGEELLVPFQGGLEQKRRIQYLSYFAKGFIGMASPEEQPEETLILLKRFAAVFNLTFTRFNDLKIAEAHALQAEHDLLEIKAARKRAEETLMELQSAQKQLVQSEKMASLGELTAGIAHEIQNPLNFVNNFSDVSNELIDEMNAELDKGAIEEAKAIASDIKQNLIKINHHGNRAGDIVKGMLQHSRSSTGTKEPTDLNALCDEYFRLSYHGLRAKNKSFNATLKTDFDDNIGKVNIIPQDMGRVILNLITNAFYAVAEKKKQAVEGYEPTVSISTKKINNIIEIKVADNGNGIPASIKEKIFQPFFTTKPTGQGTGLGLSLAYDIIKAHGGEINVETKEGEGSTFISQIPA